MQGEEEFVSSSFRRKLIRGADPQFMIEKIVRERIFDSGYWKEKLFGINAEYVCDRGSELNAIGGLYANQRPTQFLSMTLKLLQIQPEREILYAYLLQEDFKYLTALALFYIRLTETPKLVYKTLEPLLLDKRKLRKRNNAGAYTLTYMDEFVDELLHSERSCDTILPRLPARHVLEDAGELEPRESPLDDELAEMQADEPIQEPFEEEEEVLPLPTPTIEDKPKSYSKKKVQALFKKAKPVVVLDEPRESMSIEETNRVRASLGLKPLS